MNWITDKESGLLTKIQAGANAIFVETDDNKRLEQFIGYFSEHKVDIRTRGLSSITLPDKVILVDKWNGMRIAKKDGMDMIYEEIQQESDLFSQMNDSLNLHTIQKMMRDTTTIVAIEISQKDDSLDMFLKAISDDDRIFSKASFVVVFSPRKEFFSPSTLSRIAVIQIPASTEKERYEYFENFITETGMTITENDIKELVTITAGMNLRQMELSIAESLLIYGKIDRDYIRKSKTELINKTDLVEVDMDMPFGFERIGGYDALKQFFRDNVVDVIQNKEEAEKYGLCIPKGVLLFGQAGTGKTVFAKALAKELSLPFIYLDPSNIFRSLVGESEQRMSRIIKLIDSMSPCIVFIDEIDSIGMTRDATALDGGASRKVFSILLSYLASERNNLVIGTTNRPQDLDDAFRRVGRFDYTVFASLPDTEARKEILKVHTSVVRKVPAQLTEEDISAIAEKTEWYNGAEIENLVIRASQIAFKQRAGTVRMEHFEEALKGMRIDIEGRKKTESEYLKLAEKMVNDATFIEKLKKKVVVSSRMAYLKNGGK